IRCPEAAPFGFEQATDERARGMRIELTQTFKHRLVKDESARYFVINPVVHRTCRRAPTERVRDVTLDLRDAAKAVPAHPFAPFRIKRLGARFKPDGLVECAHLRFARERI